MVEEASKKTNLPPAEMPNPADAVAVGPRTPVRAVPDARRAPEAKPPARAPDAKPPAPLEDDKSKVVHIVRRLQEEASQRRRSKPKPWLLVSIVA